VSLTAERLREVLDYNPETGVFTWKVRTSIRVVAGKVAGSVGKRGYLIIGVGGRNYYAHRLAWLHMTGEWPASEIDHADRVRTHNKWSNLRLATGGQNQHNAGARINNSSGALGVNWDKRRGCWVAKICIDRKQIYLGSFGLDKGAAEAAYRCAKAELHPFVDPSITTPSHARQGARGA
jgi:hypothetical protein